MNSAFPDGFLWGASISAYQAEGGVLEDGKSLSIADLSTENGKYSDNSVASDFYHHYKEDIRLLAEMGAKIFRFTLSWPRIIPDGDGDINEDGVLFYNHVLDELEHYGIEPLVTLYHYELPCSLQAKYGGWKDRRTIDAFVRFAGICFERFGNRIKKYITINEPDILTMYGGHGIDLNPKDDFANNKLIICHHYALAHARVVKLCHEKVRGAQIGASFGYVPVYPASSRPEDVIGAENLSDIQNNYFEELFINGIYLGNVLRYYQKATTVKMPDVAPGDMELLKSSSSDFIALNYYKSDTAGECIETDVCSADAAPFGKAPGYYKICENPNFEITDWGWSIDPIGIRVMLRNVYTRYHLPIIITENGMSAHELLRGDTVDDQYRIDYLKRHLEECGKAIIEGVDLRGYCCWSFMDLLSTGHGFDKRYGLVYVDRTDTDIKTLRRIPKSSYYWYKEIISSNGKGLN